MDSTRVPQFGQASFSRSSPEVLTTPEHNTGRLTYRPGGLSDVRSGPHYDLAFLQETARSYRSSSAARWFKDRAQQ